jgi:hypothetical protein
MRSRAECHARVEAQHERAGHRRRMPRRHDPQVVFDANGGELRLRGAHPVLLGDGTELGSRQRETDRVTGCAQRFVRVGILREQRRHACQRPQRRFAAGLRIYRRLPVRAGMRIGQVDRQRPGCEQRVGPRLGGGGRGIEAQGAIHARVSVG